MTSLLLRLVHHRHLVNFRRRHVSLPIWKAKRWVRRLLLGPDEAPLVSVIVPVRNAADTLVETLQSLQVQRIGAWEAIIVDDGSTDSTPSLVASWQERDRRIRYLRQVPMGVSHARNTGLLHAVADRVMFLDGDDWIAPDYFEQMFAALAENPWADVVYCGYVRVSTDGWQLPMTYSPKVAGAPFETFAQNCAAAIHCFLLRRQVVHEAGGFDTGLRTCEDWDLWVRIARTGASFVGVPLPLAYYRMRPGSATSSYVQMIKDAHHVIAHARTIDPRVKRTDPRYFEGLKDDDVNERWAHFAVWCAAVEAANGRTGRPALDLLDRLPDFKDKTDGVGDCLFHGLSIGARRPSWALTDTWRTAEAFLIEICERLEAVSTRPGLGRCIMENLEAQLLRSCRLASPQTLWCMRGYKIDLRRPIPDIETAPKVDSLYLRIADGDHWLDEIYLPLFGPIASRDLARLILEDWRFQHCLKHGPFSMRLHLAREVAADVARSAVALFRGRRGRRRQMLHIIRGIRRGLRAGALLAAAGAPPSLAISEPKNSERAAMLVERWRDEMLHRHGASSRPTRVKARHAPSGACGAVSPSDRREFWNQSFEAPDPWNYTSPYEQKKYERTLALLPDEPIERAMELACAEGLFTDHLAPRVKSLLAIDISEKALARAQTRCGRHANVQFQCLDLIDDAVPGDMDLIVCSEVLYFLKDTNELRRVAEKLKSALAPGGRILTAHAFVLSDDRNETGFDWDNAFGAKTIDRIFSETPELGREKSLVTVLYRIDLYRKLIEEAPRLDPKIQECALDSPMDAEVECQIAWGGAFIRRSEARRIEVTEHIPILMYHRVSETGTPVLARYRVEQRAFEQQLRFLRQHGYYGITAADLLEAIRAGEPLRGRPIMLTFDDAYRDFFDRAWPLLQRYDFPSQVFVVTEKVAGYADWDASYGEPAPLMSWDEIVALSTKGVGFGSHLATHRAACGLPTDELLREAASSRFSLEARLQTEVRSIALPFGLHNRRVIETLKICGYEIGVTIQEGVASIRMDPLMLPRLEIVGSDDLAAFARKVGRRDAFRGTHR